MDFHSNVLGLQPGRDDQHPKTIGGFRRGERKAVPVEDAITLIAARNVNNEHFRAELAVKYLSGQAST
jgi:hypothetical protein